MINIVLANISIEVLENGYVIEWKRPIPVTNIKISKNTENVIAVASAKIHLLELLDRAIQDTNLVSKL